MSVSNSGNTFQKEYIPPPKVVVLSTFNSSYESCSNYLDEKTDFVSQTFVINKMAKSFSFLAYNTGEVNLSISILNSKNDKMYDSNILVNKPEDEILIIPTNINLQRLNKINISCENCNEATSICFAYSRANPYSDGNYEFSGKENYSEYDLLFDIE